MEGNQMKMRDALVGLAQAVREFMATKGANFYPDVVIALEAANAALSEPARTCDVGTPDERMHRYQELCREISARHERIGAHAPPFAFPTEFEWEDRPYEEGDK